MTKESDRYSQLCFLVRLNIPLEKQICLNPCFWGKENYFICQNCSKNKLKYNKISLIGRLPLFCHYTAAIEGMKVKGLWALLCKPPSYNNYSSCCLKAWKLSVWAGPKAWKQANNIVLPTDVSCCLLRLNIISRLNLFISRFRAVFPCQHCTSIQAFSYPGMCFLLHLHRQGSFNILLENSLLGQWVRVSFSSEHCTCSSFSSPDLADQDCTHSPAEELLSIQQLILTWASCLSFSLSYQCWNTIILQLINTLMCCLLLTDSRNACT